MRAIGLMSGTSLDGVDAAAVETDGQTVSAFGPALTLPYTAALRASLRALIDAGEAAPPAAVADAAHALTLVHAEAVARLDWPAELIGLHGQTILHAPQRRLTWQIGDPALLARLTCTPVACDFRLADVAAGGQGAPLVPVFHQALADSLPPLSRARPLLVVNIGGVANATFIGADATLLACDTGPGNALLDDWMAARTGQPMDSGGLVAGSGCADESILADLLADPFFALPPPKSLDRQHFAAALDRVAPLSTADGAATLAALTARGIAAVRWPAAPLRVLICGGGRHNAAIMAALRAAFAVPVAAVEQVGWDGDALEAQCFGFLAARVRLGLALSFPGTTGVDRASAGGRIVSPRQQNDGTTAGQKSFASFLQKSRPC